MDDDLDFDYGADTEVYYSCGASLYGEMFIIGGRSQKRQVNKGYIKVKNTKIDYKRDICLKIV